jgi:hypothetical protein
MDGRRHASATLAAWLKMRLSDLYQKLRRPFVRIAQPARHNRAAKLNGARGRLAPLFCEANRRSRCFLNNVISITRLTRAELAASYQCRRPVPLLMGKPRRRVHLDTRRTVRRAARWPAGRASMVPQWRDGAGLRAGTRGDGK